MIVDTPETCSLHGEIASTIRTMSQNQVTQSEFYEQLKDIHRAQNECNTKVTEISEKIGSIDISNKKKEILIMILVFAIGFMSNNLGWTSLIP